MAGRRNAARRILAGFSRSRFWVAGYPQMPPTFCAWFYIRVPDSAFMLIKT